MAEDPRRRWFRFSLRTVFVVTTALAVWCALYAKLGNDAFLVVALMIPSSAGLVWIWAVIDLLRKETKFRWALILLLGSFPGLLLYIFVRRPARSAELVAGRPTQL